MLMKGFTNLGNTCYLNSGLQMIIQNKDLCNVVLSLADKSEILNEYGNLIKQYYSNRDTYISPEVVKSITSTRNKIFFGYQQQDSSEFIITFLDILNEEINKVINENIVDEIYQIEISTNTKCKVLNCLSVSTNIEKSTMLMLNIDDSCNNLDDCYRLSKRRIKFEDDNKYFCEKCNKKRIASQRKEISLWPKHLIICLKRFTQNGDRYSRNSQEIMVPVIWREKYRLKGIVYHSGSLHGGHYVYIGCVENKWYLFNDDSVSEIVNNKSLINFINNGYLYYFTKE